ncbi:hypothetical protein [Nitrosomonas sp. Nm34]|uniref:hypothetical protein n=1 Tax=Nitrosomonas sp. Nm34 TaxID=1881055 RepID=UPI0008EC94B2|nr:hypothetical protein [Nitrosomonas sp. Nm34]SFI76140.1 hypothetical protein SAMN05428978_103316 [Nitrosomonas sp. Nm34]
MKKIAIEVNIKASSEEFDEFVEGLRDDLSKVSREVRKVALDIIELLPNHVSIASATTSKSTVAISIAPSKSFIALREAIKTGNFDGLNFNKSLRKASASAVLAEERSAHSWLSIGNEKVANIASLVIGEVKDHPAVTRISKPESDVIVVSCDE